MHYADIKKIDIANGEGVRVSLFVSGCRHHCKGCFNQSEWDFDYGDKFTEKEEQKIFESKTSNNENRKIVKAPMVGTFYLKPSPTSEAYVEIGKTVKKGDTLCIIEAMKLMNEIESEFDGKIIEICVKDGEAVEYGKPLFVIE